MAKTVYNSDRSLPATNTSQDGEGSGIPDWRSSPETRHREYQREKFEKTWS